MTEQDLKELDFKKIKVPPEDSGCPYYYYYIWKPTKDSQYSIVSDANDCVKNGEWTVELFDLVIKKRKDLEDMIDLIKRLTCKKKKSAPFALNS